MHRRDLLKGLGWIGASSMIPLSRTLGAVGEAASAARLAERKRLASCWLTPVETEGPFYFDPNLVRQDITEGKTGVRLHLVITVMNLDCVVLPDIIVDIWHCSKDGLYSGYNQPGGNTLGQTFLRGSQITSASGVATFDTIYPGWYPGRATHIHFKARLTSTTYATSQFAFPEAANAAVYATSLYVSRGPNPTSNAADMVFQSADPQYLEVSVTPDGSGGYTGTFTIGISADVPVELNRWGGVKSLYRG